ncbi:MAG: metallophosphoesterase [Nanoarchaeota archaeon]
MKYSFLGKSLIVERAGKRTFVVGDLHLGYDEGLRSSGVFIVSNLFEETKKELTSLLEKAGQVDEIILLGDLKHIFGQILTSEWKEIFAIIELLRMYCSKIIFIKGNHDVIMEPIAKRYGVLLYDYYLLGNCAFLHGDRDFPEIYDAKITCWVVGHAHPAISIQEGVKNEKYKCFLVVLYKRKKVIVLPSFFPGSQGIDIKLQDLGLIWPLDVKRGRVFVVNDTQEVLDFGALETILGP